MGKENLIELPGLIDSHVHARGFDEGHKEDMESCTSAAISGGVITILCMPNTRPSITTPEMLERARQETSARARCDWGYYYGASKDNVGQYDERLAAQVFGLKMYLNSTHGPLLLTDPEVIRNHLDAWPKQRLILVHAEDETVLKVLEMVRENPRPVHFCHISQAKEMDWVRAAKEAGLPITCEVTPHHLFLTEEDERILGPFGRMKPPLRTARDIDALWKAIDDGVIDTIASDHAPHTVEEKKSGKPPFGVPGVETTLPLLLTAVAEGRLSLERLAELTATNPARIFGVRQFTQTYVEIVLQESWVIDKSGLKTKCGWSPFEGKKVTGRIKAVYIRGEKVFDGENVLVQPGSGEEVIYVSS